MTVIIYFNRNSGVFIESLSSPGNNCSLNHKSKILFCISRSVQPTLFGYSQISQTQIWWHLTVTVFYFGKTKSPDFVAISVVMLTVLKRTQIRDRHVNDQKRLSQLHLCLPLQLKTFAVTCDGIIEPSRKCTLILSRGACSRSCSPLLWTESPCAAEDDMRTQFNCDVTTSLLLRGCG